MTVNVVGIGGSLRVDSQSERVLRYVLANAEKAGARITTFAGPELSLPFYDPFSPMLPEFAQCMVAALRDADGVVLVSPGYHGTVSGLVKNALDYIEELRTDERPYLDGRAVGCIATAQGWQTAVTTLSSLRSVVHALRGWPTPLGAAINSREVIFDSSGHCTNEQVSETLQGIGRQVVEFALARRMGDVPVGG